MQRRAFVTSCAAAAAFSLVPLTSAAQAPVQRVPVSRLVFGVRSYLSLWEIEAVFEDAELRCYAELAVDWTNSHLEFEDGRQLAVIEGDEIVTEMDYDLSVAWLETTMWGALVHATFALSFNWDPGGPLLSERLDEFWALKARAEAHHDRSLNWLMEEAERRYEIGTVER